MIQNKKIGRYKMIKKMLENKINELNQKIFNQQEKLQNKYTLSFSQVAIELEKLQAKLEQVKEIKSYIEILEEENK